MFLVAALAGCSGSTGGGEPDPRGPSGAIEQNPSGSSLDQFAEELASALATKDIEQLTPLLVMPMDSQPSDQVYLDEALEYFPAAVRIPEVLDVEAGELEGTATVTLELDGTHQLGARQVDGAWRLEVHPVLVMTNYGWSVVGLPDEATQPNVILGAYDLDDDATAQWVTVSTEQIVAVSGEVSGGDLTYAVTEEFMAESRRVAAAAIEVCRDAEAAASACPTDTYSGFIGIAGRTVQLTGPAPQLGEPEPIVDYTNDVTSWKWTSSAVDVSIASVAAGEFDTWPAYLSVTTDLKWDASGGWSVQALESAGWSVWAVSAR